MLNTNSKIHLHKCSKLEISTQTHVMCVRESQTDLSSIQLVQTTINNRHLWVALQFLSVKTG